METITLPQVVLVLGLVGIIGCALACIALSFAAVSIAKVVYQGSAARATVPAFGTRPRRRARRPTSEVLLDGEARPAAPNQFHRPKEPVMTVDPPDGRPEEDEDDEDQDAAPGAGLPAGAEPIPEMLGELVEGRHKTEREAWFLEKRGEGYSDDEILQMEADNVVEVFRS